MGRAAWLARRPVLLAACASTGVVGGHVLDALGLLPGVHESAAVRAAALAPAYDVLTVGGAAVLGVVAEALLRRRRPWVATAALLGGQTFLLWVPEELAHAKAEGSGEAWGALAVAVGLQVVLAAGAVGVAVLIDTLLLRLPRPVRVLEPVVTRRAEVAFCPVLVGRIVGGVRGRGPPVSVTH
jgi:hypothetical protein